MRRLSLVPGIGRAAARAASGALAQPAPGAGPGGPSGPSGPSGSGMGMEMGKGRGMTGGEVATCRQMMDRVATWDDELAVLVEEMKSKEGGAKVDALAGIVEKLVEQRREMHTRMREMPHMMCGGGMMMR
jgi:hypothetical protein